MSNRAHHPVPRKLSARVAAETKSNLELLAAVAVAVAETEVARQEAHENRRLFKPAILEGVGGENNQDISEQKYCCATLGCGLKLELLHAMERHCEIHGQYVTFYFYYIFVDW
jgi:hypothetical protein